MSDYPNPSDNQPPHMNDPRFEGETIHNKQYNADPSPSDSSEASGVIIGILLQAVPVVFNAIARLVSGGSDNS